MSKEQKKIINQLLLERIEKSDDEYDAGNKMLTVSIDYKKDGWRPNPRGYYLSLHVNLHTDNHLIITAMSFGDKGDPYAYVLIEPAKMFSAKKLNQLTITPQQMDLYVNSMIDTYRRRRATQLERRETNKQRNAEALLARQREKEEVHS